ncbi:MAG: septal ring lytic transglycosylase RlpA family protein [Spirochaetales bacterium]|nr:septal ring lytic transglycosylase RlpA family protein [Spirochaetales bacterium]
MKVMILAAVALLLSAMSAFAQSSETGIASYYGDQFDGHLTASGQPYDPNAFTAAHRTLRLGVRLEVVNLDNGKWTVVTVNDRGPYVKGRLIDVSKAAAEKLGMIAAGTARVRIWPIPLDETPEPPADLAQIIKAAQAREHKKEKAVASVPTATVTPTATATPVSTLPPARFIQVGAFQSTDNAKVFFKLLVQEGFTPKARVQNGMNRIYLEAASDDAVKSLVQSLEQQGHPQVLVMHEAPPGNDENFSSN